MGTIRTRIPAVVPTMPILHPLKKVKYLHRRPLTRALIRPLENLTFRLILLTYRDATAAASDLVFPNQLLARIQVRTQ